MIRTLHASLATAGVCLLAACASESSTSIADVGTDGGDILTFVDASTEADDTSGAGDCDGLPDTITPDVSAGTGEPCLEDTDCRSGFCLDLVAGDNTPGLCSDFCADESDCPEGQDCLLFTNSGGDAQRICVALDLCFDNDNDTFGLGPGCRGPDCNDDEPLVNLLADEVCDGVDNNCDINIDENPVGIGTPCETGFAGLCATGFVECITGNQFCTPVPPTVEVCDGIDNDCDDLVDEDPADPATFYLDADGDLFGSLDVVVTGCRAPDGFVAEPNDCDDTDPSVRPGTGEVCNGVDDNCDGVVDELPALGTIPLYPDADGDGFGTSSSPLNACAAPEGYSADAGDCNDGDASVNPDAAELCNLIDDDCDGAVDEGVTPAGTPTAMATERVIPPPSSISAALRPDTSPTPPTATTPPSISHRVSLNFATASTTTATR